MLCSPQGLGDDDYAQLKLGSTILRDKCRKEESKLTMIVPEDNPPRKCKIAKEVKILLTIFLVFCFI